MKKIFFFIVLLNSLFFTLFAQQKEYDYIKIDSLLKDHSIMGGLKAIKILEKDFANDSINATYWIKYAKACQISYKNEKAKNSIEKAIKKDSTNAKVYAAKGSLYGNLKDPKTALNAFNKAILINPNQGVYYYYRGVINHQLYKFSAAESDYKKAIANNYKTSNSYNKFATLYLEKENYNNALTLINKVIDIDKNFAEAYSTRAMINFFLLDFGAACSDKKTAIEMGYNYNIETIIPNSFCASTENEQLNFAAQSFLSNKTSSSFKLAIVCLNQLINKDDNNAFYFLDRGYAYFNLGDTINTDINFKKALSFNNSDRTVIYENIISLYVDTNKLNKAIQYLDKQINDNLKNYKAYVARGKVYFALKNYKKAKKNAKTAININPKHAEAHILLGKAKHKLGNTNYCTDFNKAKQLGYTNAKSLIDLYCN